MLRCNEKWKTSVFFVVAATEWYCGLTAAVASRNKKCIWLRKMKCVRNVISWTSVNHISNRLVCATLNAQLMNELFAISDLKSNLRNWHGNACVNNNVKRWKWNCLTFNYMFALTATTTEIRLCFSLSCSVWGQITEFSSLSFSSLKNYRPYKRHWFFLSWFKH